MFKTKGANPSPPPAWIIRRGGRDPRVFPKGWPKSETPVRLGSGRAQTGFSPRWFLTNGYSPGLALSFKRQGRGWTRLYINLQNPKPLHHEFWEGGIPPPLLDLNKVGWGGPPNPLLIFKINSGYYDSLSFFLRWKGWNTPIPRQSSRRPASPPRNNLILDVLYFIYSENYNIYFVTNL